MILLGTVVGFFAKLLGYDSIPTVTEWNLLWFSVFLLDQILIKPLWEKTKKLRNLENSWIKNLYLAAISRKSQRSKSVR
jgi:hypothetical protein